MTEEEQGDLSDSNRRLQTILSDKELIKIENDVDDAKATLSSVSKHLGLNPDTKIEIVAYVAATFLLTGLREVISSESSQVVDVIKAISTILRNHSNA